jgi:hypothetical protein
MRPEPTSNTNGSSFAICRLPTSGSYAGNMSSGRRQGPSRSMMLVIVTSPILSVCILISTAERYHGSNVAAADLLENGERRVSERIAAYAL